MRPGCILAPLRQAGGMMMALPVRPRSLCISANKKRTFTRANEWSAKRLFPLVSLVFPLRRDITRCFRKTPATSRPCLAIMSMIMAMLLDQMLTHEKMPVRKGAISMARECRMRCSSGAVTQCIRATSRHSPRPTVASGCRDKWRQGFSTMLRSERRSQ